MGVWSLWPINYSGLLSPHCDVMVMCGTIPGIWLWLYGYPIRLWVAFTVSRSIQTAAQKQLAGINQLSPNTPFT